MYEDWVFHLDLCTLAYQLHAQTLIWPMDPYYEQMRFSLSQKDKFMERRRRRYMAEVRQRFQPSYAPDGVPAGGIANAVYRGPGSCVGKYSQGWASNLGLDPIISDYNRLNPWLPSFTRPSAGKEPWIVYNTPQSEITSRIKEVRVVRYSSTSGPNPPGGGELEYAPAKSNPNPANATDILYCFEGGTGAIGDANGSQSYPAWSLMGFVLARKLTPAEIKTNPFPETSYDVHIVFRGSRSGSVRPKESLWSEKGNPDWATDADLLGVVKDVAINHDGKVLRGFRTAARTMLAPVMGCLDKIAADTRFNGPPRYVTITGHSLGGALACHFTSAVMLGDLYGPLGLGGDTPDDVQKWAWGDRRRVKLRTFSAPAVGNEKFVRSFRGLLDYDCIWLWGDPITSQFPRHYRAGKQYRIPKCVEGLSLFGPHEPRHVRKCLIADKNLQGIPFIPVDTRAADEPWQVFPKLGEMINHLNRITAGRVDQCMPNFVPLLLEYLDLLTESVDKYARSKTGGEANKAWELHAAVAAVARAVQLLGPPPAQVQPVPNALQNLHRALVNSEAAITAVDQSLFDYLGICLILAYLSYNPIPKGSKIGDIVLPGQYLQFERILDIESTTS